MPYAVEERNIAMCRLVGRPRRVLDVGCGVGENGRFCRSRGAIVTGLERNPTTRAVAARALHEALDADIEDDASVRGALGDRRFDAMLFGDVLEHVADPGSVLRRMMSYLEPEGHVLLSLPNVAAWPVRLSLGMGRFRYADSGVLDRTHLRFFTRETARQLCADAGLQVMRTDQNPMLVRAARPRSSRGCARSRASRPASPPTRPPSCARLPIGSTSSSCAPSRTSSLALLRASSRFKT